MTLRILVVDDEPDILKIIKAMVEPMGFEVLTFADGREAAQRSTTEKFDGVIVDAQMPNLNGFDLVQHLRASPLNSGVPIVMLTGSNDIETMRKGFQVGITFFLNKPISQGRLSALMNAMRGPMLRERRRHARLPFRATVTCLLDGRYLKAESVDISEGGILLDTSGGASVGQELDMEFPISESVLPLRARAKVVRKEPPNGMAVQFLGLKPEHRQAIQRYIAGKAGDAG